jgi:hypothetical protein
VTVHSNLSGQITFNFSFCLLPRTLAIKLIDLGAGVFLHEDPHIPFDGMSQSFSSSFMLPLHHHVALNMGHPPPPLRSIYRFIDKCQCTTTTRFEIINHCLASVSIIGINTIYCFIDTVIINLHIHVKARHCHVGVTSMEFLPQKATPCNAMAPSSWQTDISSYSRD